MQRVYVSGALTNIDKPLEVRDLYESIGLICRESGLHPYVPHFKTDPLQNPDITPRAVFETDKYQVNQANLVIAYIGIPSLGVGMELAYAEMNLIPIILLYEQNKVVSRFPRGIPTVIAEIQFSNYEDALFQLKNILDEFKTKN